MHIAFQGDFITMCDQATDGYQYNIGLVVRYNLLSIAVTVSPPAGQCEYLIVLTITNANTSLVLSSQ